MERFVTRPQLTVKDYLPEPNTPRQINKGNFRRRAASIGATIALAASAAAPLPIVNEKLFSAQSVRWGGKCLIGDGAIPGRQLIIQDGKEVSSTQCIPSK
jgi:hypothetical protein